MRNWLFLIIFVGSYGGCIEEYTPPLCNDASDGSNCTTPLNLHDCDSNDRVAHAGEPEICDGIDNDCDGQTDTRECETICGIGGQVCDEFGIWGFCNTPIPTEDGLCSGMS